MAKVSLRRYKVSLSIGLHVSTLLPVLNLPAYYMSPAILVMFMGLVDDLQCSTREN